MMADAMRSSSLSPLLSLSVSPSNSHAACSTCIVEINEGLESTTIRSLDESSTLRDNPANYRLSCVTDMYDDVTVTVFPPVGAAQWTR